MTYNPPSYDEQIQIGSMNVALVRGLFTDEVKVWQGTSARWPGLLFGGISLRQCKHRYGLILYQIIVEIIAALQNKTTPKYELPKDRRGLNKFLSRLDQERESTEQLPEGTRE